VVVKSHNYIRTESYSLKTKTKDTNSFVLFYYNNAGLTERTVIKRKDPDSLVFTFNYDSFSRMIRRTTFRKGNKWSEYTADYSLDSIVRSREVDSSGRLTEARIMYYNKYRQLIKFELCDSSGKVYQTTVYQYNDQHLPVRATQTSGMRQVFDNVYEYANSKNGRTVRIYEVFGGYKRLVEKMQYNSRNQLEKTISYAYYDGAKIFTAEFEYYPDGSVSSYEGEYHYSGYRYKQMYTHYKN
jgi:YD repeat-containing protein